MSCNALRIVAAICLGFAGCGANPKPSGQAAPESSSAMMHVRFSVQMLDSVPNNGLMLPSASPDGQWLSAIVVPPDLSMELDSVLSGKGLGDATLIVRELRLDGKVKEIATGVYWPTWAANSQLLFVSYPKQGLCRIGCHNLSSGQTRFIETSLRRILTPSPSPSGQQVAVAGDNGDGRLRVYIVDLANGRLSPGPQSECDWQLWPMWLSDRTLIYLKARQGKATLCRWATETLLEQEVMEVVVPARLPDALQIFAGLGTPLSPDARRLAFYDYIADSIRIIDLPGKQSRTLTEGTRFGCWINSDRFVAATDKELIIHSLGDGKAARIMGGTMLPRWASPTGERVLLLSRKAEPWRFQMSWLHLINTNG